MSQYKPDPRESRKWKASLGISLALSSTVAWAYCPPQYIETVVAPAFTTATQTLNAAVTAVDTSLSALLETESQRLTSAIAVLTKQKALAANQIAESGRNSAQQTATALNVLAQTDRVKKARFDYGGEFGQGFSPCIVYATRSVISNRDADMTTEVRQRVKSEITAAPGVYADPVKAQTAMVEKRAPFCTQGQVDSGLCRSVGTLPGADLSVATLFEPAMEGEPLYDAKVAFVNNIAGLPDGPVPESAGKSSSAQSYTLAKSRKDALVSPALAGLKQIQLDTSGVEGTETGSDLPLSEHFRKEVQRYSGNTPEYESWAKVMSAQNERGAMVEILKIKALDLALQEKQYRQYESMEAQLASLVSMEVAGSGAAEKATSAGESAATQNVTNSVK
ncbi:hypothetical protein [Pseudomonas amygdali]|uniref:hypothetical protein n=1 Tax=Pseudomonas amygdali TaxID=47877 RepID=UPI0006E4B849|nr:hypothetical protein [Pseudomonas amygdali]KPY55647.1 hypothetical protein ALO93_200193 [Pseudomonas amygdali pv. sesami]